MSIWNELEEMLSREEVADLVKSVGVMSLNPKNKGQYLNLYVAKNGEVEWQDVRRGSFDMKNKIIKNILPLVKDKIGEYKFVDRDIVYNELGIGQPTSSSGHVYKSIQPEKGSAE